MLTVLFATRNGAATLPGVLEAYCRLEAPLGGWKLVVVDNGSTDTSRRIVSSFENRLPLTYVFEPQAGKNVALNTGLDFCSGDLVVLTDDDAFPEPEWLVRLRNAADANPTMEIFGGRVVPRWEVAPPPSLLSWVPLAWTYTVSDVSLQEGPVDGRWIFGPNMAVRTSLFNTGCRFDPSIGPNGSRTYAMGSETEFVLRAMAGGAHALYVPTAIVEHFVRRAQMNRWWIIRRAVRAGRCECRLYLQGHTNNLPVSDVDLPRAPRLRPSCFGLPLPLVAVLARRTGSALLAFAQLKRTRLLRSVWSLAYAYGFTIETRGEQKGASDREV